MNLKESKEKYSEIQFRNLKELLTKKREQQYKKRMHTVEPSIDNLKHNLGYRQFLLRETDKANGEFNLMCIGHNLKKIHKKISKNKNTNLAVALSNAQKNNKNKKKNTRHEWEKLDEWKK